MEDYMSFNLNLWHQPPGDASPVRWQIRFVDSLQFLQSSLASLVSNLPRSEFHVLGSQFPDPQQQTLLTRKGVYPYEYMDSFARFDETQVLTNVYM